MKQQSILLAFFHLSFVNSFASALPFHHLVTFDPNDESLGPKEITVAAQLQVSPRIDGKGDYELKEVPLISRRREREVIKEEEEKARNVEEKEKPKNIEKVHENVESGLAKNIEPGQLTNQLEIAEESTENAVPTVPKPFNVKQPIGINGVNPIYITIPIYVNSAPGLPVTLSVGNQRIPLKNKGQANLSRRQALEEEESPTSQYNKLL